VRGDLTGFEVLRPARLGDALAALAEREPPIPLAGGTDLFVALNDGRAPGARYLDLSRLDELAGIEADAGGLRLGALTTYSELRRSRRIARSAPVLAEMAATVGAIAIQNRGTLGGSLGNASPASDPAPVLLALGAEVELAARHGRRIARRRLPLDRFFVGYRRTAAQPGELIVALRISAAALDGWRYAYRKVGTRRAQSISKVVAAVGLRTAGRPPRTAAIRIAFGSMAPTPVRAPAAEGALTGRALDAAAAAAAAAALLAADLAPIDDLRSTAAYRALVAGRLLRALLGELGGFAPGLEA
jgi:CO/xanthine dehydrogenase FAD-binding subunit